VIKEMKESNNFKDVLNLHKTYIATLLRLSMVDNLIVQEALDRVVHVCLRFLALCTVQEQLNADHNISSPPRGPRKTSLKTSNKSKSFEVRGVSKETASPADKRVSVPIEEIEDIRRDFNRQSINLYQIMKKVENRGFIFRIDFNGYVSNLSNSTDYLGASSSSL
jgi:hypothetical protein